MQKILTYQGTVYPWQCDHMGHLNVQHYVAMFDQANWNFNAHIGLTAKWLRDNQRGMAGLEMHINYLKELMPGDNVRIETGLSKHTDKIIFQKHLMTHLDSGKVAAEMDLTVLHMDLSIRKGTVFPDLVLEKIQAMYS